MLLAMTASVISCSVTEKPSVSLKWEMGCNADNGESHTNRFILYNNGTQPLDSSWVIYYNELPRQITQDSSACVKVECVMSDYFKMYPSSGYKPIQPGDSLVIDFTCSFTLIKTSHGPLNPFIVFTHNGKELAPEAVPLIYAPIEKDCQLNIPVGFPYPYGDVVYADNEFITPMKASQTDIFPSVKYLKKGDGEVSFSEVSISAPKEYENEADLLAEKLMEYCGVKTIKASDFQIKLAALPSDITAVNDEYYQMKVTSEGIVIEGNTPHAVFNGTQTLLALLKGCTTSAKLPQLVITDYPDLEYRGQMIDVARNFIKKDDLLKLIDIFASYKLNRLHLHLSDDEGWRIEIPGIEELTEVGSRRGYSPDESLCLNPAYGSGFSYTDPNSAGNGYYSKADFIEILQYASKRHIQIIPEIDFPGHARAAIVSMKARYNRYKYSDIAKAEEYLLTDFEDKSKYSTAQFFTDNVLCVAMESTYTFIDKVIYELVKTYNNAGVKMTTLHIGGDEVPEGAWSGSKLCLELMEKEGIKSAHDLNPYFFGRIVDILAKHNIPVSGWQELGTNRNATVNPKFIGKSKYLYCWNTLPELGIDRVPYDLANAGYDVVLSNVTNLYLDLSYSRHQDERGLYWGGFNSEVNSFDMAPYSVYRSVRRNLNGDKTDILTADRGKTSLLPKAKNRVKGIQGQLFQEVCLTFDHTSYALFPKILGLVERGWNATPAWSLSNDAKQEQKLYKEDLSLYYAKIFSNELPWLAKRDMNIRINPPGFKIVDGVLYMNNVNPEAEIRYTLDGTEPTTTSLLWSAPVDVPQGATVKAKALFLGKQSVTTLMCAVK